MDGYNDFRYEDDSYLITHINGMCLFNGNVANSKAGVGVWFYHNCPYNISKPIEGRATNIRSELVSAYTALDAIRDMGFDKAKIITDSTFAVSCATGWIDRWRKNGWETFYGTKVKNQDDLLKLEESCKSFQDLRWEYIEHHSKNPGNEEAYKLAKLGADNYQAP